MMTLLTMGLKKNPKRLYTVLEKLVLNACSDLCTELTMMPIMPGMPAEPMKTAIHKYMSRLTYSLANIILN